MPTIRKKRAKSSTRASKVQQEPVQQNPVQILTGLYGRLLEEELKSRQRIIEEENRCMSDILSTEVNMRSAVMESELKAKYDELKKDVMDSIMKREWNLQLVQGKLAGMEKAQEFLMREKEAALQLATKLQDQLDLTQTMFFEEREMLKSRINQLEKAYQESQQECIEQRNHASKVEETNWDKQASCEVSPKPLEGMEAPDSPTTASGADSDGDSGFEEESNDGFAGMDEETAALVEVLKSEVEVYREQITTLQSKLNSKNRDEERTSLLVAVLNTQLESVREENKHLHEASQKRMEDIKSMQDLLQSERDKYFALLERVERAGSETSVKQTQLQLELDVHKKQVVELSSCLEKLSGEHKVLVQKHEAYVENAIKREQEDYRANVSMKATLEKHQMEKEQLLEANKKAQNDMFNYKVLTRAEMDSLRGRLRSIQEVLDQKEQEHTKAIRVVSSESEQLKAERNQLWTTYQTETQDLQREQQRLNDQRNALAKELEELKKSSSETEKQLYENLVIMTACHDSKKEELERQQARSREKDKEYTSNMVFLRAENENLKSKMTEVLDSTEEKGKANLERVSQLERQIAELNSKIAVEYLQRDDALAKMTQRADLAERNVRRLQNQLQEAQENGLKKEMDSVDTLKSLRADARELKSELDLAKRTIERLEGDIGDRANYKHLATMNEHLSEELNSYRAQVDHLKNQLLSLKSEEHMVGGRKVQQLVEENEKVKQRTEGLERAQSLVAPLLTELRAHLEGPAGSWPVGLRAALEKYDSEIASAGRLQDCPTCGQPLLATADRTATTTTAGTATAASGQEMNKTLPAVLQPRPPSVAASHSTRLDIPSKLTKNITRIDRNVERCLPQINTF